MNKKNKDNEFVDFGFDFVDKNKKNKMVYDIFHSVYRRYDLMNDLMSFGIHRLWKRLLIQYSDVCCGQTVLDLAGGTGDIAAKFCRLVGMEGIVILADVNFSMLQEGQNKLRNLGLVGNLYCIQTDAELLPFKDEIFDCIAVSFGLRNFTDKALALRSMHRVLKPGGKLLILEFSKPLYYCLSKLYDLYSFYVLPMLGKIIVNDEFSYRYLVESIRVHPDQDTLKNIILDNGFYDVEYFNITGGVVALHIGYKV